MNLITSTNDVYECYQNSKFLSIKHSSYFEVYQKLLSRYKGSDLIFVEVGVLNGGSLFMWREFFGTQARIIGIDLNPQAKKWERFGFEVHIGSQSDINFWKNFFINVGKIDVLIDDGGHTNEQQIITSECAISNIKDGGLLIVEDVHASYLGDFGNPSKYSFVNYAKNLIDIIGTRYSGLKTSENNMINMIHSISFYESIVCFSVDRTKCEKSFVTSNNGITDMAEDFRYKDSDIYTINKIRAFFSHKLNWMKKSRVARQIVRIFFACIYRIREWKTSRRLRKYF